MSEVPAETTTPTAVPISTSAGVIRTITFLRIASMTAESSTARRYASSINISHEPCSGEWIEPDAQ